MWIFFLLNIKLHYSMINLFCVVDFMSVALFDFYLKHHH